ncbi:MAG: nitronate monooxygenase [Acidobacteriota bacterium]
MNSPLDRRFEELIGIELPMIQAPMAGVTTPAMVVGVAKVGALGSLPCAMLSADQIREQLGAIRQQTSHPVNLNFFCHQPPEPNPDRDAQWKLRLLPYYRELGLDPDAPTSPSVRNPFDEAMCRVVEECKPQVVSFHFGLPPMALLQRVKDTGAKILSSATTVEEAVWLEQRGCDAIIAQGVEGGGHRGMFLTREAASQSGIFALLPQIVDAVKVPVIAAGGIADVRSIVAAFWLGACAVQLGTAYLYCSDAKVGPVYRRALREVGESQTAVTNLFTGRPARAIVNRLMREIGPLSELAPEFPLAGAALAPLRAKTEPNGPSDFVSMWCGQAAPISRRFAGADDETRPLLTAEELTARLAVEVFGGYSSTSVKL